ncbi:glycoside hydrolase family 3 N-terminal domain-containing protein [Sphingosinicella sp. CPCC 101087]|uniref:glycoside hydrolase family 3 N-terminal domain-containing protein n=1 Tax=Sphingosinicella sp. CPCC 101087 TaxID=2497754 RepID=UPI00101BC72E|nr:glycoside hydrolase family 3 N-terminal domain-containing protein [Sphingosinicella sp. CPCC 101087]
MVGKLMTALSIALCLTAASIAAEPHPPASHRIESLLARMTIEEKLGQLTQLPGGRQKAVNSRIDDALRERVRRGQVGSLLNVAGADATRALQRVAVEESRLGIPLLYALDIIHGYRTIFPVPLAMAAAFDPTVSERAARVAAVEASAAGVHWTFSPMVDVAPDPRWGRIVEGSGEDPYLGSAMAVAQVRGYQGDDLAMPGTIMATAKHFAAYGAALGGRDYDSAEISERTLNEIHLPPFHAAAAAGAGSFMAAFNTVSGLPMHANRPLLTGLLRGQWTWQGPVVSDWMGVAELIPHGVAGNGAEAAALALAAGVDIDMSSELYFTQLRAAVERDPTLLPLLDHAVRRVLAAKERLGLFDDPYRGADPAREAAVTLSAEHRAAAREAALRSIVLLKNEGGVLPIARTVRRVAVIGALADDSDSQLGSWRALGREEDVRPLLAALRERLPEGAELVHEPGASPHSDDRSGIPRAVEAARRADLVLLVVGEDFDMSGEARSRSDLSLPGAQQALADAVLDTGKPVAVVLMNGRPLVIDRLAARAPAILETWFLGVEAGPAIADVLIGRAAPGGRLPVSFPRASGALPFTYNRLPSGRPADPDITRDTVRYHDLPVTPLFPFGHGLSYTSFDYGSLAVDRASVAPGESVTISVTVRNAGRVAGDEVVQLYARDPVASVSRPVQELRGFRRIALAPGKAKRVSFTLTPAQFAIWDDGRWRIEPGEIQLMVGSSSADIRSRGAFRIAAEGEGHAPAAALATVTREETVR